MTRPVHFEVFRGEDGWYWRVRAANGEITAQSEGYTRHRDALRAMHAFQRSLPREEPEPAGASEEITEGVGF